MNREIKFRAWDLRSQDMLFVKQVISNGNHVICKSKEILGNDVYLGYNEFKIMEFTGLKDRNGVEIYEGDVVFNHIEEGISKGNIVSMVNGCWSICQFIHPDDPKKSIVLNLFDLKDDIEVVGNYFSID